MENKAMEFKHYVIEGTPHEAGKQLGDVYKQDYDYIKL
jgi:hypothetical protein